MATAISGDRLLAIVARRGWAWLTVLGVTAVAGTAGQLLLPAAIGRAVDAAIAGGEAMSSGHHAGGGTIFADGTLSWLAACVILVAVIAATEVVGELATGFSGAAATARLREILAAHVLAAGTRLTRGGISPGDAVSRVVGGAAEAGAGPTSVVSSVAAAIPPVGSVVALGLIDPWLAVAFLAGFPVLLLMMRRLARDAAAIGTGYGQAQGAIAARLLDALAGARTIAAAGTQSRERDRILGPLPVLREHGYASWRVQARAAAQGMLIAPLLQVIVLAAAGLELAHHRITPGDLLAASQYAMLAVGIGASTSMVARLGRARGGATRAAGLLTIPAPRYGSLLLPTPKHSARPSAGPGARVSNGIPGELRLRGVTVRHGDDIVLDRLDLTIPGGACVALVGKSGAGKSTLAELAGRLADPDAGSVTLDGIDLRDLSRSSLRTSVVYAFERPHLFGRTPREVISFGSGPPPAPPVIAAAANDSRAAAFITRLPRSYDTRMDGTLPATPGSSQAGTSRLGGLRVGGLRVGGPRAQRSRGTHARGTPPRAARSREAVSQEAVSQGPVSRSVPASAASSWTALSGGEIQRLGLARAFAHAGAARLLILDDAMSSLDTVTEMLVSEIITGRLRGRTRLIVAHRVATAARADLVAWLDGGRIRGLATHERLWLEPEYRALFGTAQPGAVHGAGTSPGAGAVGGPGTC